MSRYSYSSYDSRRDDDDSEYYRMRRERGYHGPQSDVTRSRATTSRSSRSGSFSDDDLSYYSGYSDGDISFKNMDAARDPIFIPAAHLPHLTAKRDIQIEQPLEGAPRPLPPKKAPRPKLEDYWQPNLSIIGCDADPVVIEGFRKIAAKAVVKYRQEEDICGKIKYEMDRKFGRPWCCIYGEHFDSFVTHDGGMFLYFKLENKYGLLWRNRFK